MIRKISLGKLLEKLDPLLEKGEYLEAGILAENAGYEKFAEKYYSRAKKNFIEEISINNLKREINTCFIKDLSKETKFIPVEKYGLFENLNQNSFQYNCYDVVHDFNRWFTKN